MNAHTVYSGFRNCDSKEPSVSRGLFLKTHLDSISAFTLAALIVIGSFVSLPPKLYCIVTFVCALLATIAFFVVRHRIKAGIERGALDRYGDVLAFCPYPCPGTSMLSLFKEHASVQASDIEEIKLHTCAFDNPYLENLSAHLRKSGVKETIPFEIMGFGDESGKEKVKKLFPHAKLLHSTKKLYTHFNLIKAKGRYYLWYEPHHDDKAKNYIPSKGAFLVDVKNVPNAMSAYYADMQPAAMVEEWAV